MRTIDERALLDVADEWGMDPWSPRDRDVITSTFAYQSAALGYAFRDLTRTVESEAKRSRFGRLLLRLGLGQRMRAHGEPSRLRL